MTAFSSRAPQSPGCFGRRLRSAGLLCLAVCLGSGLLGGPYAAFTAPPLRCAVAPAAGAGQPAVAPAVAAVGTTAAPGGSPGGASAVDLLEALRQESLEACIIATEDDPDAVERCSTLSYELANAEQLMLKRQAAFRYVDNDSY
eukprot:CAMPEP_0179053170 /NCGR_PEP_ID=MMETSP0796-20121207/22133_1 /TAXON_ID=73915 /ORGANISM="Pyrodinium bahamense, Strain pbaha01" /LENGTH=143 /DNA_ID=CAMNT_0020749755 /DNA_START=30 /DNA_END=461 /DNA_ORIENTATION=+